MPRPDGMQHSIAPHAVLLATLLLGSCAPERQAPQGPPLPATVNADCAPADGAAFTISIPIPTGRLILISVYQAPEIRGRATFSFPDPAGRVGNAIYLPELDAYEPLMGTVSVLSAQRDMPIEGEFDLSSETGFRYRARFLANWGQAQAFCG